MIPLTFLCDEYIDRPKLTEQKNPFEYIVPPPPTSGVGTKNKMTVLNFSSAIIHGANNLCRPKTRYDFRGTFKSFTKCSRRKFTHLNTKNLTFKH